MPNSGPIPRDHRINLGFMNHSTALQQWGRRLDAVDATDLILAVACDDTQQHPCILSGI